jgi:hypothetical protein
LATENRKKREKTLPRNLQKIPAAFLTMAEQDEDDEEWQPEEEEGTSPLLFQRCRLPVPVRVSAFIF